MMRMRSLLAAVTVAASLAATGCGSGSDSPPAPTSPPSPPSGVQAVSGNAQVTVSWSASTGATSYNLYWSTISGSGTGGTKVTGVTSPYARTGLTNGTRYYFVVTAVNAAGESAASTEASAVPVLPIPAAPANPQATPGDGQVQVSWSASASAASYNLYWSTTSGAGTGGTKIADVTSPYTHSGRTNGATYYYVVTAQNASGESGPSAQVSATPAVNPPPAAPTGVTATGGDRQVSVSWNAVAGATSYDLYWSTTSGAGKSGTRVTGVTSPYVLSSLTNGTTYYFVVTAVNANGESGASAQASATPTAAASPPYVYGQVLSMSDGGPSVVGFTQQVDVCADAQCSTALSNATVTVNGQSVPWDAGRGSYRSTSSVALGATVSLSVTVGGVTYTGSGTQFTAGPTLTAPASGATWQASSANTISWTGGSPTTGAAYVAGVMDGQGRFVYPTGDQGPQEVPVTTTSVTVPAGSLAAGSYMVMTGIATPGIVGRGSGGLPIANAASGSGLWLGVVTVPLASVTVQASTPPAAPTGVTATGGDRQVSVSWNAVAGATSYNLYWSTTSGAGKTGTRVTGVTSPHVQASLTNGTTYYFVVTAVNANGESTASSQASATPTAAASPPYVYANVLSMSDGGATVIGFSQQVEVCADAQCGTPISNATVTVNGQAVPWDAGRGSYQSTNVVALGATVSLSVTVGGVTYTGSGTQFTAGPTLTAPASGATWQASSANTISWTGGSPTTGAAYVAGVMDGQGRFVYPTGDQGPQEVPVTTTSVTVPAGSLTAGSYMVMTGIATPGIVGRASSGLPIANAASGSGLWLGVVTVPLASVTVQ